MSEVKVNKISPRTGTDVELNSSAKITNFTSTGIDDNADATAITIDSSENVLVKKTSVAYQTVGHELKSDGRAFHTADGGKAMSLVRKNSDGSILDFYIDGTEEGSIQVAGGGTLALGAGNTFLRFQNSDNTIRPTSNSGFSNRDNAIDLGASNARWNDLYLGGNIYLGGTGSNNSLNDYETGSWTPNYSTEGGGESITYDGITSGSYVKIGRLVLITGNIRTDGWSGGSSYVYLGGFPFTVNSDENAKSYIGFSRANNFTGDSPLNGECVNGDTKAFLKFRTSVNGDTDNIVVSDMNTGTNKNVIYFTGIYRTT